MKQTRTERQKEGVKKWIAAKCRGVLAYATGVGKTYTSIMAIQAFLSKNKGKKIVVIVPTDNLKIQWIKELIKHQLHNFVEVEIINSAIKRNDKIDLAVIDEIHTLGSDSYIEFFKLRNPTLILGLSATFERLDGRHQLIAKYCKVVDIITMDEAIENNWLSSYKEYKVLIEPDDIQIYNKLNQTFNSTFAQFDYNFKLAMECVGGRKYKNKIIVPAHKIRYEYAKALCTLSTYDSRYYPTVKQLNSEITANAFTWNRALQDRKSYVMNHPKKIEIAQKILDYRPDSKAITFSATIKQAEKIKRGYTVHSGKTKKKNRLTLEEFEKLETGVINTSKALDAGADIDGLNLGIILCGDSSKTRKTQRLGRTIRFKEGKEAEFFTLILKGTQEENWFNNANEGKSFIEITEYELDAILKGEKIQRQKQKGKDIDMLFRF